MKSNQNKNIDLELETAYDLSERSFTHEELINLLKDGNIQEKQIAALKFDYIKSTLDAEILVSNLTGCDGKIREAVAYRINYFVVNIPKTREFFAENSAERFADATIDINANICRLVVNSAIKLKEFKVFSNSYTNKILKYTKEAFDELDKFIFRDKKYMINKQIFKLYWCLEAISYFYEFVPDGELLEIIKKGIKIKEYTIREKCAQILRLSNKFPELKKQLEDDENYYVRQVFTSSRHF